MLIRLFLEPGDPILCEEYTYPHVPESLVIPPGYKSIRVEIDEHGIIPEKLRETLESFDQTGDQLPRVLYTIPTGQNPTGANSPPFITHIIRTACKECLLFMCVSRTCDRINPCSIIASIAML